ncbi:MAG TPA: RNA-binding domain-containing protein [Nitrososphaerales archaeon]|nr:RNA-binding domain-containing protein [Nitrososphaerales archaeon]
MRPELVGRVALEATVSPSEDRSKVLAAMMNILGEADHVVEETQGFIRVESSAGSSLDRLHDQLRDRQVRGAARKRLLAGRTGKSTTVMVNRQAATAGVIALCDTEAESPLGPVYLFVESERLDDIIRWLTDYPEG